MLCYKPKHGQSIDLVKGMHLVVQPTRWVVWCTQERLKPIHSATGEENIEILSLLATQFFLWPWRLQARCASVFSRDVLTNLTCIVCQDRAVFFSLHSISLSGFIGTSDECNNSSFTCSNIAWVSQVLQCHYNHNNWRKGKDSVLPLKVYKILFIN